MPLSCDCYGGCWGVHSKDWPSVQVPRRFVYWKLCEKASVPYGSFVNMDDRKPGTETYELRVETEAFATAVRAQLSMVGARA